MSRAPRSDYREMPAPAALAPYVECLWVQAIAPGGERYDQPVLPDGCTDLVTVGDDEVWVAGPMTRAITAHLDPGSVSVGVRLRTGAAPLLGIDAAELRDQDVSIGDLWGRSGTFTAEQAAEAAETGDWRTRLGTLVDALIRRLEAAPTTDPVDRVPMRLASLLQTQPSRPLPRLADEVALSERQLRRRVEVAVGYPPRVLARILRFQRFLRRARAARDAGPGRLDLARLAAESGYADQAHLTRESSRLTGLPPARLLDQEAQRLDQTADGPPHDLTTDPA